MKPQRFAIIAFDSYFLFSLYIPYNIRFITAFHQHFSCIMKWYINFPVS